MTAGTIVRELMRDEFPLAERLWVDYHNTIGDPDRDRIFAVFKDGEPVSIARCRQHPDEVDGVFTPEERRGHGYAGKVMEALIEACQHDTLYMHSVLNLSGFYAKFGFVRIDEKDLPPTIRARYEFALGEMEGSDVQPMKRVPGRPGKRAPGPDGSK
jgi:GNAT superfamily N-acetyltransferase